MNIVLSLLSILKAKIWFATVGQYRGLRARWKLYRYVRTLSPRQQAWANDLRQNLKHASTPGEAVKLLRIESQRLNDQSLRLIERLDRAVGSRKS